MANTAKLFQENSRRWNTLDIQEYSSSQKLEVSRNVKLFFPADKCKKSLLANQLSLSNHESIGNKKTTKNSYQFIEANGESDVFKFYDLIPLKLMRSEE